jgi:hypothetical protein
MSDFHELAGSYIGQLRVREGMEKELSAAERAKFKKSTERVALVLRADGSFHYKGTTEGVCSREGDKLLFTPTAFNGQTLEAMEKAAFEAGRMFGLAWLFNAFELRVAGEVLVSTDDRAVMYMEYLREGG